MNEANLRALLRDVAAGETTPGEAMERLRTLPFQDLGFARLDHHRALRTGRPEVVYGEGKTAEQIAALLARIGEHDQPALATRVDPEKAARVVSRLPNAVHNALACTVQLGGTRAPQPGAPIAVVSAGTSDERVAEEAVVTLQLLGSEVIRVNDVGVAGLHRLLSSLDTLRRAVAIIVVAGMEGALPSVLAGLVPQPIIAVPTSVGYGASFHGLAALLTMLSSCAPGVVVVNIDNGFGAACAASAMISRRP